MADALGDWAERERLVPPSATRDARVRTLHDLSEVARLASGQPTGWYRRAPGFEGVQSLQTGDLVLVRGVSDSAVYTEVQEVASGAAASPYSHVALAYRDPVTQKVLLVESKEPVGVQITPASDDVVAENARTVVLRVADPAQRAAAVANIERTVAELKGRMPIGYDSWLDDNDASRYDCAELTGHLLGAGYPETRTSLEPGMAAYARRAGMPNTTMALPGDFAKDSRFATIAEGMNPALVRVVRPREAASREVFERKNAGEAVLQPGAVGRVAETLSWLLQKVGVLGPFNERVVGAAFDLRRDAGPLNARLVDQQKAMLALEGRVPTARELRERLAR